MDAVKELKDRLDLCERQLKELINILVKSSVLDRKRLPVSLKQLVPEKGESFMV